MPTVRHCPAVVAAHFQKSPAVQVHWIGPDEGFFGFGGALGAAVPSGETDADGVSPFACSRPTSRRGKAKSSARPAGGASGSPLTKVRAASASTAAGREPGPPSN